MLVKFGLRAELPNKFDEELLAFCYVYIGIEFIDWIFPIDCYRDLFEFTTWLSLICL